MKLRWFQPRYLCLPDLHCSAVSVKPFEPQTKGLAKPLTNVTKTKCSIIKRKRGKGKELRISSFLSQNEQCCLDAWGQTCVSSLSNSSWWWLHFSKLTSSVSHRAIKSSPEKSGKDITHLLGNLFGFLCVLWVKMTEETREKEAWISGVKMGASVPTLSYTLGILRQVPPTFRVFVSSSV